MKTSKPDTICPYPGLRSFTEEESLFFKGREDQVDTVCGLLQHNKFLMVTGASGEGKSSLIYAGLIPNARAGFFKARYTNWLIADFRPERTPLHNMATAVGGCLEKDTATVETELRRGFSSLMDLYKNSRFYVEGKTLSLEEKRHAANLLVIVDQFEEFFTNPENYFNEAASVESQTVVNLALETARIAQHENLPVYVICTMRSDYIGQCSAFRGLPEFIGYSQFFVPRLKRKDLIQVIEEPAILSGNRITRRLVERLVYDLADGIDQLPILQHALSQIWHAADQGQSEMDLLHYAQVGGMPDSDLPEDQRAIFDRWFESLPERQRHSFIRTGLNRVIEIHADQLYENSGDSYLRSHPDQAITERDTRFIIALTFACLTRIDHSRAVRNRMTLREITAIINQPHLTEEVVAEVIRPYRLEENALVRPFDTGESKPITSDTVLDITHESLIRNWGRLKKWADQEFEYFTTLQDFKKQLGRWKDHQRSSSFLLPIGPLSYYENWITKAKPNPHWINRYSEYKDNAEVAWKESSQLFEDLNQFITASARKVWLTRTWMKYGTARLVAVAGAAVLLVMSSFYLYDASRKRNDAVIEQVVNLGRERLKSEAANSNLKIQFLVEMERLRPGSFFRELDVIKSENERINVLLEFLREATFMDIHNKIAIRPIAVDSLVAALARFKSTGNDQAFALTTTNQLLSILLQENYYNPKAGYDLVIQSLIAQVPANVGWFYDDLSRFRVGVSSEINYALHLWLTAGKPQPAEIQKMVDLISPFVATPTQVFATYYRKDLEERNGRVPIRYGGGYHLLACLYAALGQTDGVIKSFEEMKEDPNYFTGSLFNNYNQVIGHLYNNNHRDQLQPVLAWLGTNFETNTPTSVLRNTVIRAGYLFRLHLGNYVPGAFRAHNGYAQPILWLLNREVYGQLCNDLLAEIAKLKNPDERSYLTAMQLKRQAVMLDKYNFDRGLPQDTVQYFTWLDQAWENFGKVSDKYLSEVVTLNYPYWGDGIRNQPWPRKWFFIYPDYIDGWFANTYSHDLFFRHADRNGWIEKYYNTAAEYDLLHYWVSNAHIMEFNNDATGNIRKLSQVTLERVWTVARNHSSEFDGNLIALVVANRYFESGDTANGIRVARMYKPAEFLKSVSRYEYMEKTWITNLVMHLTGHLAVAGQHELARSVAEGLHRKVDQVFAYWNASMSLYRADYSPESFEYLDSALARTKELVPEQLPGAIDYRDELLTFYGVIGGSSFAKRSLELLRDLPDGGAKFGGRLSHSAGRVLDGNYYEAFHAIPNNITEAQELIFSFVMLDIINQEREKQKGDLSWRFLWREKPIFFFYPN